MTITQAEFGNYQGSPVYQYTIENAHHSQLKVLSYAATWQDFIVQDDHGNHSLVTHFDHLDDYVHTPYQVGKTVGRVAGRIGQARFNLAGQTVQLTPNEGANLIHGGDRGLQTRNFDGQFDPDGDTVNLTTTLRSSEDGFPGDLTVTVSYTLTADDVVQVTYRGQATATTLFNPTCHVYFNVGDGLPINQQILTINARKLVTVDDHKVPTGIFQVTTPQSGYDFQQPQTIQAGLRQLAKATGKTEFDDCYKLDELTEPVAQLQGPHHALQLCTDRNGLIIFTANPKGAPQSAGIPSYQALAMELQVVSDAINHPGFGDIVLPAGETRSYTNQYRYLAVQN